MMKKIYILLVICVMAVMAVSCNDEESEMGMNLADSSMLYSGIYDTLYANLAYSKLDDSLLTSNYSFGIIGNYNDATYGSVKSVLYTQIALPTGTSSINFNEVTLDSVVLSFGKDMLYPDTMGTYNFHFEVKQLSEPLLTDTAYYSKDVLSVDENKTFFDDVVKVSGLDSVVRLRLNSGINSVISQSASTGEFVQMVKGLRIRIKEQGSDQGMLSINFQAITTCMTAYYRYKNDTITYKYVFVTGYGASHFTHFEHNYSGTIFANADSVDGSNKLYLDPMAGHSVIVNFNDAIQKFNEEHPRAVVHMAELILPVNNGADKIKPDRILALRNINGALTYIDDYVSDGIDGTYNNANDCYRLRISRYLQGLIRDGKDEGTLLVLNSRRSSGARTILNGIIGSNPVKIIIVYSE